MRSAVQGAIFIISYSAKEHGFQVTPLKLQKLLYYVQAWSLVFNNEPFFKDALEAWVHGPVVPQVYRSYKHLGAGPIQTAASTLPNLKAKQKEVLQVVLSSYGNKDGRFLEDLTHSEAPWIKARTGLAATDKSNRKISLRNMKSFYTPFVISKMPPRISPRAMAKKDNPLTRKKDRPFLTGLGSVVDICPPKSRKVFYTQKDFQDFSCDLEEMASDWENVGGSIRSVIENASS